MISEIASAGTSWLRRFDPDTAQKLALWSLRLGLAGRDPTTDDLALATRALVATLSIRLVWQPALTRTPWRFSPLMRLGFGFIELGTVTPRPQAGNPRPRIFRLDLDHAVVNRLGFNNHGLPAYLSRVATRPQTDVAFGCNVGINKEGADPERDYPLLIEAVTPYPDYIVINVSSPNTPGLRDLQGGARLRGILQAVGERVSQPPPLLLKIAPDLSDEVLGDLIRPALPAVSRA